MFREAVTLVTFSSTMSLLFSPVVGGSAVKKYIELDWSWNGYCAGEYKYLVYRGTRFWGKRQNSMFKVLSLICFVLPISALFKLQSLFRVSFLYVNSKQ